MDKMVFFSDRKNVISFDCWCLIVCKVFIMRYNNYINLKNCSGFVGFLLNVSVEFINKMIENNYIYCFCVLMEFVWLL